MARARKSCPPLFGASEVRSIRVLCVRLLTRWVLSLLAVEDEHHLRAFIVASTAGIFALFPLLIKSAGEQAGFAV